MYIEEIKIKNFKSFRNAVKIDLCSNARLSQEDVIRNSFYKNEGIVIPKVVSFTGANSSGKTTILDAIMLIRKCVLFSSVQFDDVLEFLRSQTEDSFFNDSSKEKTEAMEQFIEYQIGLKQDFVTISNYKDYDYSSCIKKIASLYKEKYNNSIFPLTEENIKTIYAISEKNILNLIKKSKPIQKEQLEICICLYDEKLNKHVNIAIDDFGNSINISYDYRDPEININIQNFFQEIYYVNGSQGDDDKTEYRIIDVIKNLDLLLKYKSIDKAKTRFCKLIKILDPNIADITLRKKDDIKEGIKHIETQDQYHILPNELSSGTKRFIAIFKDVLSLWLSNNSSLLLIDEFDNYLHNDIIDFFKKLVYFSNKPFQLIFTSHNYLTATNELSNKQIFYIEVNGLEKEIKKITFDLNKNKNAQSAFEDHLIGSHPMKNDIQDLLGELLENE